MNIGAGRIVLQDDTRLDLAMRDGSFQRNETLCRAIHEVKRRDTSLHLIGLLTEKKLPRLYRLSAGDAAHGGRQRPAPGILASHF